MSNVVQIKKQNKKTSSEPIKFLTPEEEAWIRAKVLGDNSRDALLIRFIMHTGCRASEALAIKKSYFADSSTSVFIPGLKGSLSRQVPLPKDLYSALKEYISTQSGDMLFDISYSMIRKIWYKYSPDSCRGHSKTEAKGIHSLRHTAAINLYKRCRNIYTVRTILGHKDIANTMIYMTYVDTVEELAKAMGV